MALPATIGRYEILERLGEGGMGAVYLGRDPNIGRLIAVKVLHGHLRDPHLHQRFVQEARSAGALTHPNIVTVHDFGEVDGAPFLVMEYVRGQQLAAVIKRREPVPLATKLGWLEGLCAGLHYAHESKIIHRDVKPQNLMLDERGTLKILDFGIARVAESGLTKMSMVIGTPGYMSPEQIDSRMIDRRSDIFSAGAVAYALISYREAFEGDSVASVMHRVINVEPPSLSQVCEGLPPAVAAVVARALRKAPDDRFQTAGEMQRAFAAVRQALPPDGPEPATAVLSLPPSVERRTPVSPTPADFRRRRSEQIERHVADAQAALGRGDLAGAASAAEAALVIDPDHAEAQRLLHLANQPHTVAHPTEAIEAPPDPKATWTPAPRPVTPPPPSAPPSPPPAPQTPAPTLRASTPVPVPPPPAPAPPLRVGPPAPQSMRPSLEAAPPPPAASRPGVGGRVAAGLAALGVIVAAGVWATRPAPEPGPAPPQPAAPRPVSQSPSPAVPSPAPPTTPQAETATRQAETVTPPVETAAERTARDAARLMAEASAAERSSRLAEARARYQDVLRLVPRDLAARAGLARVEARLAPAPAPPVAASRPTPEPPSAEERVRANGLVRRATSKYEAGDYDGAIADLKQALASVPGHEAATTLLATVLRAKDTEEKMRRRPPPRQ